jgi:hypothetical protein
MATSEPLPPQLDLDANPIQGQQACAVMDLKGQLIRGSMNQEDASILFQMLVEVGSLGEPSFRRLTVSFAHTRYIVARDETHVYIAQTRSS